jgi:hypothetical protein
VLTVRTQGLKVIEFRTPTGATLVSASLHGGRDVELKQLFLSRRARLVAVA